MSNTSNTKRFTVAGHEYELDLIGARTGRKIWHRLIQVLAGGVEALGKVETINDAAFASALAGVVKSLDEPTAELLYDTFGATCRYHTGEKWPTLEPAIFDEHFRGRYLAMSEWLVQCTLLNFANFFEGMPLGQIVARVVAEGEKIKAARPTAKTTESTGSSGAS